MILRHTQYRYFIARALSLLKLPVSKKAPCRTRTSTCGSHLTRFFTCSTVSYSDKIPIKEKIDSASS